MRVAAPAQRGEGVHFIEKHDAGRCLPGLLKDLAHALLAFPDPLGQEFRPFDGDEVDLGLAGQGLGQQGLSRAGRTVEQDTPGRSGPGRLEEGRVFQRPLDGLQQVLFDVA